MPCFFKSLLPLTFLSLTACSNLPTAVEVGEQNSVVEVSRNLLTRDKTYRRELDQVILKQEKGDYEILKTDTVTLLVGIDYKESAHPSLNKGATVLLSADSAGNNAACFEDSIYDGDEIDFCIFDTNKDGVFNYGVYDDTEAAEIFVPYKINSDVKQVATRNYRKREIVFRGVKDNRLHFDYLEYAADLNNASSSDAFKVAFPKNSKVTFDYKGAKFEVVSANNFAIKYRVLSHFKRL